MRICRRDFLRMVAAAAASGKIAPGALATLWKVLQGEGGPRVVWLQGAGCDGCAVSVLNSIHYAPIDEILTATVDLEFQSNLMAAAGDLAVSAAEQAAAEPGYILVVEGAIPTGAGGCYCVLWPGMTMHAAVLTFAQNAGYILALGACACFGGVSSGTPNPTDAKGVREVLGDDSRIINLPGCPAHPDWLVGTIVYLLTSGQIPPLDAHRRPLEYFGGRVHDRCSNRAEYCGQVNLAASLSEPGCMEFLGCKGKHTYSDCPMRKWNSGGRGAYGVNWCVGARSPCLGCVNPGFPDSMSPFYVHLPPPEGLSGLGSGELDPDYVSPGQGADKARARGMEGRR